MYATWTRYCEATNTLFSMPTPRPPALLGYRTSKRWWSLWVRFTTRHGEERFEGGRRVLTSAATVFFRVFLVAYIAHDRQSIWRAGLAVGRACCNVQCYNVGRIWRYWVMDLWLVLGLGLAFSDDLDFNYTHSHLFGWVRIIKDHV